jgi:diacylglycerol kinase family enzyme
MNSDEIPIVLARYEGEASGHKLFCYGEKTVSNSDGSQQQSPVLVSHTIDGPVPAHLQEYVVPYRLQDSGNSAVKNIGNNLLPVHLKNLAVIDSTYSGSHKSSDIYFNILLPLLKAFGLAHVYVSTTSPRTIPDHSKSFSSSSTVIFLAGDTSIHEFINSLQETKNNLRLTVVAIPTGTGNALSTSVGHQSPAHAISRLFLGSMVPLSNFKVKFPEGSVVQNSGEPVDSLKSLVVSSWGFHAALVADSDSPENRALGPSRFQKAAADNIKMDQRYSGRIRFKSSLKTYDLQGPHSYVLFTAVSNLEKGFLISPDSYPYHDDSLHVVQFNHTDGQHILNIMKQAYNHGNHINDPFVLYRRLDMPDSSNTLSDLMATIQVNDTNPRHRRWCVDGRIILLGEGDKMVKLYKPSHRCNGWQLFIVI